MLGAWNRQRAGATDEPFARAANNIMPAAPPDVMDALAGSLDNLALAATNNKTALQQLKAANLALTTTVSTLTIANKKLTDTVARFNLPKGVSSRSGSGKQTQSHLGQLLLGAKVSIELQNAQLAIANALVLLAIIFVLVGQRYAPKKKE